MLARLALVVVAALASACNSPAPSFSTAHGLAVEPQPDLRRHHPSQSRLRALGHQVRPGVKLPRGPVLDVVGGTTEDPNTGPAGMTYGNGPMLASPQVYALFWGTGVDASVQSGVPGYYAAAFGNNTFMQGINEYNKGTSYTIGSATWMGAITDADAPIPKSGTITDLEVQEELTRLLDENLLPQNNGHNIYMIYFPPKLSIDMGGGTLSCDAFCAYHSNFTRNGNNVYYGILPDFTQGTCMMGCGSNTPLNNLYSTSSHELIEAVTDAAPNSAWTDFVDGVDGIGGEIGDICVAWDGMSNGYVVQSEWSNESNSCRDKKSTGSAEVVINNDANTSFPVTLTASGGSVTVPVALMSPAKSLTTAATGPFVFGSNMSALGLTTAFNPTQLTAAGTTQLTINIPAGVRSQDLPFLVEAADADGAHHYAQGTLSITGAAPTVTSYTPQSGTTEGGTTVTATGTNWGIGSTVALCPAAPAACPSPIAVQGSYVGGTKGVTFQLTTPSHAAGAVTFVLTNLNDKAHSVSLSYTYTAGTPPTVTKAIPALGPKTGGNTIELDGTNFGPDAVPSVAGTAIDPANYVWLSSTQMLVTMPPQGSSPVNPPITVQNPGSGSTSAAFTGYAYTTFAQPPPTVTAISATMGPSTGGTYVQLTGTFAPPVTVKVDTTQATLLSQNPSFVSLRTPAHAPGAVTVTVVAADNQAATAPSQFTYTMPAPAPAVSSLTPAFGPTAGGTSVAIAGTNLDPAATVTFDGAAATLTPGGTPTLLTVTTPAHAAGSVPVIVTNPDGQKVMSTFVYSDTPPEDMATTAADLGTVADLSAPPRPDLSTAADLATSPTHDLGSSDGGAGNKGGGCSALPTGHAPASSLLFVSLALLGLALRRRGVR